MGDLAREIKKCGCEAVFNKETDRGREDDEKRNVKWWEIIHKDVAADLFERIERVQYDKKFPDGESGFEKTIGDIAFEAGWRAYKITGRTLAGCAEMHTTGIQDVLFINPPLCFFAELKTNEGKLSVAQCKSLKIMEACGLVVKVWC